MGAVSWYIFLQEHIGTQICHLAVRGIKGDHLFVFSPAEALLLWLLSQVYVCVLS